MAQWFPSIDEAYHNTVERLDASFGTADPTAAFDPDREFGFDLVDGTNPESSVFPDESRQIRETAEETAESIQDAVVYFPDLRNSAGAASRWARLLEWLATHPTIIAAFAAIVLLAPVLGPAAETASNLTEDA